MDGSKNQHAPPPPPPPHGANPQPSSPPGGGLPAGNYDIFIIPPHSSGGGFLYLPSLRPQLNSFVAGVASTLAALYVWNVVEPVLRTWFHAVTQSGVGFGILVLAVLFGALGWLSGRTNGLPFDIPGAAGGAQGPHHHQNGAPPDPGAGAHTPGAGSPPNPGTNHNAGPPPGTGFKPNGPTPGFGGQQQQNFHANANTNTGKSAWEKAREETRKREEERKRADEDRRRVAEEVRRREEAERATRAQAEKDRWEQQRARERETREREARERLARERMAPGAAAAGGSEREARLKAAQERADRLRTDRAAADRDNAERAKSENAMPTTYGVGERLDPYSKFPPAPKSTIGGGSAPNPDRGGNPSPRKPYQQPTAQSYAGTATENAYRPYDSPPSRPRAAGGSPSSSYRGSRPGSYAESESTAPTSVDPRPYSTDDRDKVVIRGAYRFTDSFPKPVAVVRPGESGITDGLIMRMTTEGVFLDDDKKQEALRQWDIKAWTMKAVEVSLCVLPAEKGSADRGTDVVEGGPVHTARHAQGRREHALRLHRARGRGVEGAARAQERQEQQPGAQPASLDAGGARGAAHPEPHRRGDLKSGARRGWAGGADRKSGLRPRLRTYVACVEELEDIPTPPKVFQGGVLLCECVVVDGIAAFQSLSVAPLSLALDICIFCCISVGVFASSVVVAVRSTLLVESLENRRCPFLSLL
jgi:hypothetical protein